MGEGIWGWRLWWRLLRPSGVLDPKCAPKVSRQLQQRSHKYPKCFQQCPIMTVDLHPLGNLEMLKTQGLGYFENMGLHISNRQIQMGACFRNMLKTYPRRRLRRRQNSPHGFRCVWRCVWTTVNKKSGKSQQIWIIEEPSFQQGPKSPVGKWETVSEMLRDTVYGHIF